VLAVFLVNLMTFFQQSQSYVRSRLCFVIVFLFFSGKSASALSVPSLYKDYEAAQQRRAAVEQQLLTRPEDERELAPYDDDAAAKDGLLFVPKAIHNKKRASGGFGQSHKGDSVEPKLMTKTQSQVAARMAAAIRRDGVLRLNGLLSLNSCNSLRELALQLRSDVQNLMTTTIETGQPFDAMEFYGVEPGRTCRTDLLLPLDAIVQTAFSELLKKNSPLRHLLCELLPLSAPLYETACVITSPGSHRQTVHPDLPFKENAPLYVVFVALQDVTPDMGPTTFLLNTQNACPPADLDAFLTRADSVIATMNAGDAVVFDARTLHCGNANVSTQDRALFNFSFRRPDSGPLGYAGSIRKNYIEKITLRDVLLVADKLDGWDKKTLESVFGNGLVTAE
jgi:hypothetical protein